MSVMMSQSQDLNFTSTKNYYEEARKEVESWYFVNHTWPVILVLLSYSSFIYIDLKFNKQRKPMNNLKFIMLLFNIYQVVTNAQMVYLGILPDSIDYLTNHACHPIDPAKNHLWSRGITLGRMFLVSKLADLIDTVFIVLRKKESQVSVLHLYHHFSMVVFAWYCMKFAAGEQLVVIMIVNPFVHVIMYSYYALSLLGAPIQKYLWWKKYITLLQLSQFVVYMGYMAAMVLFGCDHSVPLTIFVFFQGFVFFALFRDFYIKSYCKSEVPAEVATSNKAKVT